MFNMKGYIMNKVNRQNLFRTIIRLILGDLHAKNLGKEVSWEQIADAVSKRNMALVNWMEVRNSLQERINTHKFVRTQDVHVEHYFCAASPESMIPLDTKWDRITNVHTDTGLTGTRCIAIRVPVEAQNYPGEGENVVLVYNEDEQMVAFDFNFIDAYPPTDSYMSNALSLKVEPTKEQWEMFFNRGLEKCKQLGVPAPTAEDVRWVQFGAKR